MFKFLVHQKLMVLKVKKQATKKERTLMPL